jgi:hypothetical protein
MLAPLDPLAMTALLSRFPRPEVIDVRTAPAIDADPVVVPGALVRDPGHCSNGPRGSSAGAT